jgi:hypothetical protein
MRSTPKSNKNNTLAISFRDHCIQAGWLVLQSKLISTNVIGKVFAFLSNQKKKQFVFITSPMKIQLEYADSVVGSSLSAQP